MSKRKSNKVRGVAITSIEAYRQLVESGQMKRKADRVYRHLDQHGPLNSRQIANQLNMERTSVTRSLYDLIETEEPAIPLIEILEKKPCKITGKKVYYYQVIREGNENTNIA